MRWKRLISTDGPRMQPIEPAKIRVSAGDRLKPGFHGPSPDTGDTTRSGALSPHHSTDARADGARPAPDPCIARSCQVRNIRGGRALHNRSCSWNTRSKHRWPEAWRSVEPVDDNSHDAVRANWGRGTTGKRSMTGFSTGSRWTTRPARIPDWVESGRGAASVVEYNDQLGNGVRGQTDRSSGQRTGSAGISGIMPSSWR